MTGSYLILVIILSAVTYRIARFVVLDSLIDGTRNWVLGWLEMHPNLFWSKLHEILGCPWCITVWVSAAVVAAQHLVVDPVVVPIWTWLAVSTGSLIFWRIVDYDD